MLVVSMNGSEQQRGAQQRTLSASAGRVAQTVATGWLGVLGSSVKSWLGSSVPLLTGAPAAAAPGRHQQRPRRQTSQEPAGGAPAAAGTAAAAADGGEGRDVPGMVVHRGRHLKDMPVSQLRRVLADDFSLVAPKDALRSELVAQLAAAVESAARAAATVAPRPASHSSAGVHRQVRGTDNKAPEPLKPATFIKSLSPPPLPFSFATPISECRRSLAALWAAPVAAWIGAAQ